MNALNDTIGGVIPYKELTEAEKQLPLYKYYTIPTRVVSPYISQAIDHGPMDLAYAQRPDDLISHLMMPGEYPKVSLGYCKLPEGGGFIRHYQFYPGARFDMLKWYYTWINTPCKSQPAGCGNIKYKIWCPIDHFTHAFVNGKDRTDGVFTQESMGLGMYDGTPLADPFITIRYPIDLKKFGMTEDMLQRLKEAKCWVDPAVIRLYDPKEYWENGRLVKAFGSDVMISISRPTVGGIEKLSSEWVGWDIQDDKMVYDESTPWWRVTEDWMHMAVTHTHTEAQHLADFLPELFAEYSGKPVDAD